MNNNIKNNDVKIAIDKVKISKNNDIKANDVNKVKISKNNDVKPNVDKVKIFKNNVLPSQPYITRITNNSDDLVQNPITVDFSNNNCLKKTLKKKFKKKITQEMFEKQQNTENFAPRLTYFLSQGKFFTKNFISIIIPKWISNVFELNIFITHIHKHNLLLPLLQQSGRMNELPVFGNNVDGDRVIFPNTNAYLTYDYQAYLKKNNLQGSIAQNLN